TLRRHVLPQLGQPDFGLGVARGPPISARRERAAGADFWPVREGRALELAELEEAIEEHVEPLLDGAQVILIALCSRQQVRPGAAVLIGPGMPGQESDFAGPEAMPGDEVEIEILQLIRANLVSGLLCRPS